MPSRHTPPGRVQAALVLALSLVLVGCATAPAPHEVDRSQVLSESKDVVWERAVAFFATRNLSIKTIDKASGIIAADRQITVPAADLDGYADCGTAALMRKVAQSIDLNLFVRTLPDQKTSVIVNTRFTETRILGYNMLTLKTVGCTSTGKLEGEILEAMRQSL